MNRLTRRALVGLGLTSGSALLAAALAAEAADVIVADEKAVLFKVRDVALDRVDQAGRTIAVSIGKGPRPIKLENLPLDERVSLRVSLVRPGVVNNLPFDWDRLKGLIGKRVSMLVRAGASSLSVDSIASAND